MDGWMNVKTILRIAYINGKFIINLKLILVRYILSGTSHVRGHNCFNTSIHSTRNIQKSINLPQLLTKSKANTPWQYKNYTTISHQSQTVSSQK
jgi:hypothetical protein